MCLLVSHSIAGTGKAYPPKKDDGWIDWAGGECPVEEGTLVDVRYLDGSENHHVGAGIVCDASGSDSNWCAEDWTHRGYRKDIIAYRLHQPQDANSRANDDRLAGDAEQALREVASSGASGAVYEKLAYELDGRIGQQQEDITLLTHFMLDEIRDSEINIRLDDAYELAQHLISVGYRKQ